MKTTFFPIVIVSMFLFISCGNKQNSSEISKPKRAGKKIIISSNKELENYSVFLDENTPPNLGTLLTADLNEYDKFEMSMCNWYLVSAKLAMTNAHCIPKILKANSHLYCGDYIQGVLQTRSGAAKRKCEKLIKVASIKDEGDYAVFEIDEELPGPYFKLSRAGVLPEEVIQIHTLNHDYDSSFDRPGHYGEVIRSRYVLNTCTVKNKTVLDNHFSRFGSKIVGFLGNESDSKCRLEDGNSGAPVLNSSGKLIGIAFAGYREDEDTNGINASLSQRGSIPVKNELTKNFAVITNLACQKFNVRYLDKTFLEDLCAVDRKINIKKTNGDLRNFQKKLYNLTAKFYVKLLRNLPDNFLYYVETNPQSKSEYLVDIKPTCFKDFSSWKDTEVEKLKNNYLDLEVPQLTMPYSILINYYGRRKISESKPKQLEPKNFHVSYKDKRLIEVGLRKFHNNQVLGMEIEELPRCTNLEVKNYSHFLNKFAD